MTKAKTTKTESHEAAAETAIGTVAAPRPTGLEQHYSVDLRVNADNMVVIQSVRIEKALNAADRKLRSEVEALTADRNGQQRGLDATTRVEDREASLEVLPNKYTALIMALRGLGCACRVRQSLQLSRPSHKAPAIGRDAPYVTTVTRVDSSIDQSADADEPIKLYTGVVLSLTSHRRLTEAELVMYNEIDRLGTSIEALKAKQLEVRAKLTQLPMLEREIRAQVSLQILNLTPEGRAMVDAIGSVEPLGFESLLREIGIERKLLE